MRVGRPRTHRGPGERRVGRWKRRQAPPPRPCLWCHGSGYDPHSAEDGEICPMCDGTGDL